MSDIGQVWKRSVFQNLDLPHFQNDIGVDPVAVTPRIQFK